MLKLSECERLPPPGARIFAKQRQHSRRNGVGVFRPRGTYSTRIRGWAGRVSRYIGEELDYEQAFVVHFREAPGCPGFNLQELRVLPRGVKRLLLDMVVRAYWCDYFTNMVIRSIVATGQNGFGVWRYCVPNWDLVDYEGAHVIPRLIEGEDMSYYTSYYRRRYRFN